MKKIVMLLLVFSVTSFLGYICPGADLSIGRLDDLDSTTPWEKWPASLNEPSAGAAVAVVSVGLSFTVPEAEKEMIWRRSLRPAWQDFHHYFTVSYRITGIPSASVYSFIRLRTASESWITVVRSDALLADGSSHTITVDLKMLTSAAQVVGAEVELHTGSGGGASFVMEKLQFSDQPPGYLYPPPPAPTPKNTGFELDTDTAAGWTAKPEWLSVGNISSFYLIDSPGSSLICTVNDSGKGMKWLNSGVGALDTTTYPYVLMRYRCTNVNQGGTNYFLWLNSSASGDDRPFYMGDLIDDGLWHWAFSPIAIPDVTSMAFQVQSSAAGNAFVEIDKLCFMDGDPRSDLTYFSSLKENWSNLPGGTSGFSMIDLSFFCNNAADQLLPRIGINASWFNGEEVVAEPWVPFRVKNDNPNLCATDLQGTSFIEIPVNTSASEAYFLLGAFLPAREIMFLEKIISTVNETERFYIELEYTDESREKLFPLHIFSGLHEIPNNTFSAYTVPCDPSKTVRMIRLYDGTDGGLFALAALTLKTTAGPFYDSAFTIEPAEAVVTAAQPVGRTPLVSYSAGLLTLENTYYQYEFDLNDGLLLNDFTSYYSGHNIMVGPSDRCFFSGTIETIPFTSEDMAVTNVVLDTAGPNPSATITMDLDAYEGIIRAVLTASIGDTGAAEFSIALDNLSAGSDYPFELKFPDLRGLTLGSSPGNIHYMYPSQTLIHGNSDISVEKYYSGQFPMQFMDVYNPAAGWGLYLLVRDLTLIHKYYRLEKSGDYASLSVRYPTLESTGLPAGERLETAPFTLGLHSGDWHAAMEAYRQWTAGWYTPQSPRQEWFQEIYTCRRDYPISGSGYLFDRGNNQYTFDNEIANAERYLGGADMIDISSWGWSAAAGRVGDYRLYELGGLDNFRGGIASSQAQGIPVGLYIEGYLLDDRATAYTEHGEEWKMLNSAGEEIRNGTHEVVICPYEVNWQNYMRDLYAGVISETNAAAIYIDVFGYGMVSRSCYSDQHGHRVGEPPLRGEYQLTRKIRESLNAVRSGIPLYTEYSPVDFTSQYQDGSFAYTIAGADFEVSPTATSLFRFCFPDFKRIELVNGQFLARNWTEEGLKKAFMNGEGIWIKGDIASWYDRNTAAFYVKSHELFLDHKDAFTDDAPKPFVQVLVKDIYAHLFASADKKIYTFYNKNWRDVETDLVSAGELTDKHIVDLWGELELGSVTVTVSDYMVAARLNPRDIGCVGIFNRHINASRENNMLEVNLLGNPPGDQVELVGVTGPERVVKSLPKASQTVDLNVLFSYMPEKIIVKLKNGGVVLDMYIVEGFNTYSSIDPVMWRGTL